MMEKIKVLWQNLVKRLPQFMETIKRGRTQLQQALKVNIFIIIVFVAVIGFALFNFFAPAPVKDKYKVPEVGKALEKMEGIVPKAMGEQEFEIEIVEPEPSKVEGKEVKLVDPFSLRAAVRRKSDKKRSGARRAGGSSSSRAKSKLKVPELEGIWVDDEMRVAFISGQAVTEGAIIEGWRVLAIGSDRVVLQRRGATRILQLGGE
jgi:hypothetical protein